MVDELSPRERNVLNLLVQGHSNREIGAELHLSHTTISTHVAGILSKLQARNRTHAAYIAVRMGIVNIGEDNVAVLGEMLEIATRARIDIEQIEARVRGMVS